MQTPNIYFAPVNIQEKVKKGRWFEAKPLELRDFPHRERRSGVVPSSIENVEYMLSSYDIAVRYNVIRKDVEIKPQGMRASADNADAASMGVIMSLAEVNNLHKTGLSDVILAIADKNAYNPVENWIKSAEWDGRDRLGDIYATLVTQADYPTGFKELLLKKWLLSIVAAATIAHGFRCRGVLTLQGPQGIGKTAWLSALVSDPEVRAHAIKIDHHVDPHNKDSLIEAVSALVTEIGELDSSFRKDVARIKGFLTRDADEVRRPYARRASKYPRRTVFMATVNDENFLVDDTGNTRFWTLPVDKIITEHGIDTQQLFAQLLIELREGAEWWLSPEEERVLEQLNGRHRSVSVLREKLMALVDIEREGPVELEKVGTTQLLERMGYERPKNAQAKELTGILREVFGEAKKVNGTQKWEVPFRAEKPTQWQDMLKQKTA